MAIHIAEAIRVVPNVTAASHNFQTVDIDTGGTLFQRISGRSYVAIISQTAAEGEDLARYQGVGRLHIVEDIGDDLWGGHADSECRTGQPGNGEDHDIALTIIVRQQDRGANARAADVVIRGVARGDRIHR